MFGDYIMSDIELPKGIQLRKNKDGEVIQIFFAYQGVQCREVLKLPPIKKNIDFAVKKRAAILYDIEMNKFNYAQYFPDSPKLKLFGENKPQKTLMRDLFIKQLSAIKNMCDNGKKSPSTYNGYRKVIENNLIPYFNNDYIEDLTPTAIKEWILTQSTGAKTLRNKISILRLMLNDAKNDEIIEKNPLDKIAITRYLDGIATESDYEVKPFTENEKQALIDIAEGQFKNLIQFGFWSGLRTSEMISLKWSDIDFSTNSIYVNRAKVHGIEKGTKTKAGTRKILMLRLTKEALENQLKYTENSEYVFHNPNTNKPYSTSNLVGNAWRRLFTKTDIEPRNSYQMRHTYASTLLMNGENPWWLATQMGHENTEMIFKHYGKFIPSAGNSHGYKLAGKY